MLILYILFIPVIYIVIKLTLFFIVKKYGKFSYDGFSAAGFAYNSKKNIFYSTRNAWQKRFGYCHFYDVGAPLFRIIIDTEPIRFYYNGKNWLITFWKGQYGIVTGAEIGIYSTNKQHVNKKTIYFPNKSEMLDISFTLYKNNNEITKVSAKHWWLAIFKIGMFSKPKELSMDIKIQFLDNAMLNSFLDSFKKLGYSDKDFKIKNNIFYFKYIKPRTRKVWTRSWLLDSIRQHYNYKNVMLYNKYLSDVIENDGIDDSSTHKKIIKINNMVPDILKNTSNTTFNNKKNDSIIYLNDIVYSNINESYGKKNK